MARPKKQSVQDDPGADSIVDDVETTTSVEFAVETLTGDLRDFVLDRLRYEQNKAPWHKRSEGEQRETVHGVETAVRQAVTTAVELIASHGRKVIKATIEQVTIKDGIKAILTMSKFDENRHILVDAQGGTVLVVVADPDVFSGERSAVEIMPDQATLLGGDGVMAVHSTERDPNVPFN